MLGNKHETYEDAELLPIDDLRRHFKSHKTYKEAVLDANSFKRTRKEFDSSQIKQEAPEEQQQRKRDGKLISKKPLLTGLNGLSLMQGQELQISKD